SRAGADQLTVTNGAFDLAQLLRGAAVAFRPLSERHTLTADIPDGLPQAYGDMTATDIIVGQLLENAFKYSPGGGTVTVRARPSGEWIEVTVDDEGIGIAPGDHDRIFERFVQGGGGRRAAGRGGEGPAERPRGDRERGVVRERAAQPRREEQDEGGEQGEGQRALARPGLLGAARGEPCEQGEGAPGEDRAGAEGHQEITHRAPPSSSRASRPHGRR